MARAGTSNGVLDFFQRVLASFSSKIDFSRRQWSDPTGQDILDSPILGSIGPDRAQYYNRLWAYYTNAAFDNVPDWEGYRSEFGLYRYHRSIYNPTHELVEFYVNNVYPGFLTTRRLHLGESQRRAVIFAPGTDQTILTALEQFWTWSQFQTQIQKIVRFAAALGNTLVEVVDDLDSGTIYAKTWWPGYVVRVALDSVDRVIAYTVEYRAVDPENPLIVHRVRKEVTPEVIRYFLDNAPWDITGQGAVVRNPYGLCPAIWVRHTNTGELYGSPVIAPSLAKVDELNSLVSRAHDRLFTTMTAPVIISSGGSSGDLDDAVATGPSGTSTSKDMSGRERIRIIEAPEGTTVTTLPLEVGSTLQWVKQMISEIEFSHRELSMYRELATMSVVTGPAAERIMGDVAGKVSQAQAGYDEQLKRFFQLALAMGGQRAGSGDWEKANALAGRPARLTPAQRLFLPFDGANPNNGDIDFTMLPRELIPRTDKDKWDSEKSMADTIFLLKQSMLLPNDEILRLMDRYDDDQIKRFAAEADKLTSDLVAAQAKAKAPAPGQQKPGQQPGQKPAAGGPASADSPALAKRKATPPNPPNLPLRRAPRGSINSASSNGT